MRRRRRDENNPSSTSLRKKKNDSVLCFQDVMEEHLLRVGDADIEDQEENDNIANIFFELANAPYVGYRIQAVAASAGTQDENTGEDSKQPPMSPDERLPPKQEGNSSNPQDSSMMLRIRQDIGACGQHTGGIVWETSYLLLNYLRQTCQSTKPSYSSSSRSFPCGQRVVEVGAGCGLLGLGIFHSNLAQHVVLTETTEVLANLSANVLLNSAAIGTDIKSNKDSLVASSPSLQVCPLDWTRYEEDCAAAHERALPRGGADWIVGTDVVFSTRFVEPLLATMKYLSHQGTTILLCLQERCKDSHALLLRAAPNYDFVVEDISQVVTRVPTCEWGRALDCHILRLRTKRL